MIYISIHIFPHEIKNFQRIVEKINNALEFTDDRYEIVLDVSLNLNRQIINRNLFNTKHIKCAFNDICKKSYCKVLQRCTDADNFLGVNEHRRYTIQNSDEMDFIIFLDCDLYFNKRIIAHHLNGIDILKKLHTHFILSPQVVRLWDATWDCIVNEKYLNKNFKFHETQRPDEIVDREYGGVSIIRNDQFKWGGGWFNVISANLLKKVGIPKSFVGYGPDDTFLMESCKYMRTKQVDVSQYILKNMIVMEDRFYAKEKATFNTDIPNFRQNCNKHFHSELNFFKKTIK